MSGDLVKRMAEALRAANGGHPPNWEIYDMDFEEIANAALTFLREPTEAMLDAARDWSRDKYGRPIGNDAAIGCWQAMLDAGIEK